MTSPSDYLTIDDPYERGELTIQFYKCPVRFCNLSNRRQLTKLQLVEHLRTFHKKPTLSRVLAWYAVKKQEEDTHV